MKQTGAQTASAVYKIYRLQGPLQILWLSQMAVQTQARNCEDIVTSSLSSNLLQLLSETARI
jgi:hypothetical protein